MRHTSEDLEQMLMIMADLYDKSFSPEAARLFVSDLIGYGTEPVMKALDRCRKELFRFPTIADIVQRIDDGHPGPEEAWAMVPKCEEDTVCWTTLMCKAYAVVHDMMGRDQIAARKSFLEVYAKMLRDARTSGVRAEWDISLGHDKLMRERVVVDAVNAGRLTVDAARPVLGYTPFVKAQIESGNVDGTKHVKQIVDDLVDKKL